MRKTLIFSMIALMLIASPASAAIVESGESYFLPENKTVDDNLYVTASYVDIAGNVKGDFMSAAGSIMITGEVEEDINATGGSIDIWGNVGDDVRLAGGKVLIAADIDGDLVMAGGLVQVRPNVTVGGDVVAAGGMAILLGNFRDDVNVSGGNVALGGSVRGDAIVNYGKSLTIAEGTTISGNLEYYGPKEIEIPNDAVIDGEVIFHQVLPSTIATPKITPDAVAIAGEIVASIMLFVWLMMLIGMAILALLIVIFWSKKSTILVRDAMHNFGWSLLRGILVFVFVPLVLLVLFISVIGIIPAVYLGLAYMVFYIEAMIFAGIIFGSMIFKWIRRTKDYEISWGSAIVGVLLLSVLKLIPIIGWLLWALFLLVSMGALANMAYQYGWVKRNRM